MFCFVCLEVLEGVYFNRMGSLLSDMQYPFSWLAEGLLNIGRLSSRG
jgi:hypothetical protein